MKTEKPKPELRDPGVYPDDAVLEDVLAGSFRAYAALREGGAEAGLSLDWKFYNDGKVWLCRISRKKKTIAWMSAWKGFFKATVYFSGKDLEGLEDFASALDSIGDALTLQEVGKSKACVFEIRNKKPLDDLRRVMERKIDLR